MFFFLLVSLVEQREQHHHVVPFKKKKTGDFGMHSAGNLYVVIQTPRTFAEIEFERSLQLKLGSLGFEGQQSVR